MKVLLVGGTGTISGAISHKLLEQGHTLFLLNRGSHGTEFAGYDNLVEIKRI